MPVILELEKYEADLVVDALMEGRIRLMKDWEDRWRSSSRSPFEDDLAHIDADIVAVADIREHLKEGIMMQGFCQNRALDPEKKVSVAWHRERGWLPSADFVEKPIGAAIDQDQIAPGTWTTLSDGYDVDADPFEITDPEENIVIASADTQTDGTMIGFYAYPKEADNSVNNAIWALITRNFGLVSERDIQLAEKVMKSDPCVLGRIRSSVEDLQKAYGDDGRFLVNIQVDGRTAEVKVDQKFLKVLNDLNRRFLTTAAVS